MSTKNIKNTIKRQDIEAWYRDQCDHNSHLNDASAEVESLIRDFILKNENGTYSIPVQLKLGERSNNGCFCFKCKQFGVSSTPLGEKGSCPSCGEEMVPTTKETIKVLSDSSIISKIVAFDEDLGLALMISFECTPRHCLSWEYENLTGADRYSLGLSMLSSWSLLSTDKRVWLSKNFSAGPYRNKNAKEHFKDTCETVAPYLEDLSSVPLLNETASISECKNAFIPSEEGTAFLKKAGAETYADFFTEAYTLYKAKVNAAQTRRKDMMDTICGGSSLPRYSHEEICSLLNQHSFHLPWGACTYDMKVRFPNEHFTDGLYHFKCSCGEKYTAPQSRVPCPHGSNDNYPTRATFIDYDTTADSFIWRRVSYMNMTVGEKTRGPALLGEDARVIFSPQGTYAFEWDEVNNVWNKVSTFSLLSYWGGLSTASYFPLPSATENYEKSFLRYSGCKELWDSGKETPWSLDRNGYLYQWVKKPWLNQLMNVGLERLSRDIFEKPDKTVKTMIDTKATSAPKILGVDKALLKILTALNPKWDSFQVLKSIWEVDKTLSVDTAKTLIEWGDYPRWGESAFFIYLKDIVLHYKINVGNIVEYLKGLNERRFIKPETAIYLWRDYLDGCKALDFDMKKVDKMPEDLHREHDRVSYYTSEMEDKLVKVNFDKAYEETKDLYYLGDEKDIFFIRVPKTPKELLNEGHLQGHCAWTKVSNVAAREITIVFLRCKNAPFTPFVTIEVINNYITQVKVKENKLCNDPRVARFIKKWAKTKGLTKSTSDIKF